MSLHEIFAGAVMLAAGWLVIFAIRLSWKILHADPEEFRRNKEATTSILDPVFGTLRTFYAGGRDHRINAGLAVKDGKWVEQGILSESATDAILR